MAEDMDNWGRGDLPETDEEREARELEAESRLRGWRTRKALGQAPELAAHMRSQVLLTDGRSERGFLPSTSTPLSSVKTDDADDLYARLIEWVTYWARFVDFQPTSATAIAWARVDPDSSSSAPDFETLGFRAGTTVGAASLLVSAQVQWLLRRDAQIVLHPSAASYQDDVVGLIWGLRAKYSMTPAHERPVHPAVCPTCGERAIGAVWRSTEIGDVEISCEHCEAVIPTPRASLVERWVAEASPTLMVSVFCEAGQHAACDSDKRAQVVHCTCECHDADPVPFGLEVISEPRIQRQVAPLASIRSEPDPQVCPVCWLYHPAGACDGE